MKGGSDGAGGAMIEGREPLIWGAARMLRVQVESAGRSEECLQKTPNVGAALCVALREEGLTSAELVALLRGFEDELARMKVGR